MSIDTFTGFSSDQLFTICNNDKKKHKIDIENVSSYINSRIDDSKLTLDKDKVYIECGPGIYGNCSGKICLDDIQDRLPIKYKLKDDLLTKAYLKAHEMNGLITFCPNIKCTGSQGFQLAIGLQDNAICPFPTCHQTWCIKCNMSPYHTGITCEQAKLLNENKGDKNIAYIIQNTQQCPACKRSIEKEEGCDHIKCKCGIYFCFVCGIRLDSGYRKHVVYNFELDTYVCPERNKKNKVGLASKEIKVPSLSDESDDDFEYNSSDDIEYNFDHIDDLFEVELARALDLSLKFYMDNLNMPVIENSNKIDNEIMTEEEQLIYYNHLEYNTDEEIEIPKKKRTVFPPISESIDDDFPENSKSIESPKLDIADELSYEEELFCNQYLNYDSDNEFHLDQEDYEQLFTDRIPERDLSQNDIDFLTPEESIVCSNCIFDD